MKVVVASDAVAGLSPLAASQCIAESFDRLGATVAVAPLGVSGEPLHEAVARLASRYVLCAPRSVTEMLAWLAADDSRSVIVDLTQLEPDLDDVLGADLEDFLAANRSRQVVALVPDGQADAMLTGLHGSAARWGRQQQKPLPEVLADDARAQQWLNSHGLTDALGAGAANGLGAVVQLIGGTVTSPLDFLSDALSLPRTLSQADVVVTGAENLDFHTIGGPIVKYVAELAEKALIPCIAVAGHCYVSARELRLAGIEAAYAVASSYDEVSSPAQLREVAHRVAHSWNW